MSTATIPARRGLPQALGWVTIVALIALAVAARFEALPVTTLDMTLYLIPWYERLARDPSALGDNFSNYAPAYLYLLKLLTLVDGWIASAIAIKLLSMAFDCVCALVIYRIVRLDHPRSLRPTLAAAAFFALPSVVLNSAAWGQADSIYTTFLLATVLFTLDRRGVLAMACFSLALAVKLQAIFLLPFVLVMTARGVLPWRWYALIPLTHVALALPAVASGRPWREVLLIYAQQVEVLRGWSYGAPNPYLFVTAPGNGGNTAIAVALAAGLIGAWMLATYRSPSNTRAAELHVALASVVLASYLLPRMHERYFYPADALALAVVFCNPALWMLLILSQVSSTLTYGVYLLRSHTTAAAAIALLTAFTVTTAEVWLILRWQFGRRGKEAAATTSSLSPLALPSPPQ